MPVTNAIAAKYAGSRDVWGGHAVIFLNYTGPASYDQAGDQLQCVGSASGNQTGLRGIDGVIVGMTVSGTYYLKAQPTSIGPTRTWNIHWYVSATNAEVAGAVNLSAEQSIITVIGT